MTEQDKIYAASVLDQGSFFSIYMAKTHRPTIRMRRSNADILKPIKLAFGGSFGMSKDGLFWLNFVGNKCTDFLLAVLPYLKVKTEHARVILEFNYHAKNRRGHLTAEEKRFRDGLMERLKSLNSDAGRTKLPDAGPSDADSKFDLEL